MFNWFFNLVTRFFKLIVMMIIIIGVCYLGACVFVNFIQTDIGEYKLPQVDQAQYVISIKNTGNVFFTNTYEIDGTKVILHGYWEMAKDEFKYRDRDITLDKKVFGEIIIGNR